MKAGIYNMDCQEAMREFSDNFFELAIVDPPYGINISQDLADKGKTCRKNGYREWEYKEWDKEKPTYEYFYQLFRISKNQIIWGGNYFHLWLYTTRCWLIWDKKQRDFSFADGEMAWTSFRSSLRIFDYSRAKLLQENKIHPTQKPIKLYEWLLMNYAKEGDKILDTHLGSGSSAIAAHRLGFKFWGYEIDKDYYEAAVKRINLEKTKLQLF